MTASLRSTGITGVDQLLEGLKPGDNVVWRVDRIGDYQPFCEAAANAAVDEGRKVVYFRFAQHPSALRDVPTEEITATEGFEHFITTIHAKIIEAGPEAMLVFDSLSDLSARYYSDRMIGNFFQLTCPLVYSIGSVAYFSLDRYFHSYHTVEPVTSTTQVLIDVFRLDNNLYIQPIKTDTRRQDYTFILYRWDSDQQFTPIKASSDIAEIVNSRPWPGLRSASYRMVGVWDRVFMTAETRQREIASGMFPPSAADEQIDKLLSLIISRDERIVRLAKRYLTLADIIAIWKRMIGTGFIGGKSIGMLLAHSILRQSGERWQRILEDHDSFFVGSDVYYTFLVINDVWWERQQQKDPETFLEPEAGVKILNGRFPDYIVERFKDMLDYFGKSPIIVRSSSLMEDNFGNAFAGKYESVFCTNQGTPQERLEELLSAVRMVYASSVSDEALQYRKARGLLDQDEQMALLIQRVSGAPYKNLFFPQLAGVAFSFNPYAWHRSIDPDAGVVRLVFGLGTRAVDRADDDYTRVVALNAPEKRPEGSFDEVRRHAQRRVDVLDFEKRRLVNVHFIDLLKTDPELSVPLFATADREVLRNRDVDRRLAYVLTFDRVLKQSTLVRDMRDMLHVLREAYETPVDVEFTVNFFESDQEYRINVVQCRPLQIQGVHLQATALPELTPDQVIMKTHGGVVGHSRVMHIRHVIYVRPQAYSELPEPKRYELASVIGKIAHTDQIRGGGVMMVGPGRWGTSTPSLGIPVRFADIEHADVLCEIDHIHGGLIADLSLGTHFFNELVEMNLLYLAYIEGEKENIIDRSFFEESSNKLSELYPEGRVWEDTVRVVSADGALVLNADGQNQTAVLYRDQ